MWVYLLLLIIVFILFIIFIISTLKLSYKIIKKYVSNKVLACLLSAIPIIFIIIGLAIDFTNAIVVDLHLIVIIFITKLIFYIIGIIIKKDINNNLSLSIGVLLTIIVMCKAYYLAHNVVETDYKVYTNKNIGTDNFRIVQISDSHLGTTMNGKDFSVYMKKINKLEPDIVVITGDFIDDGTSFKDFEDGAKGLGSLKTKYGVYFVFGNHDIGYYNNREYTEKDIRNVLQNNNVTILEDEYIDLTDNIILLGRQDKEIESRKTIYELTNNIGKNKFIIDLNHQPNDYKNEENAEIDLVLSGHTHGGQLIPLGQLGVLFGANDKIYGIEKRGNTTFIVNSGISDWALKFKTGTISEYVVIDLLKK